ncbi:MAG: ATP-dependent Clp protease ATP-binding subunit ClpA, partial [Pseudomonadota bacterium]
GARDWLAKRGFDAEFGARPLARVISEHVKKPMAEELLFGKLSKGGTVKIGHDKKKDILTFKYVEEKPAKRKPKAAGKGTPEKV